MIDLRQGFHDWLLKQGLSEKTKTGRPGTVYEYITRLDRLSQRIFNKVDWYLLGRDICGLLAFHCLFTKKWNRSFPLTRITDRITLLFKEYDIHFTPSEKLRLKAYARWAKQHIAEAQKAEVSISKFFKYLEDLSRSEEEMKQLDCVSPKELSQRSARNYMKLKRACKHDFKAVNDILTQFSQNQLGIFDAKITPANQSKAKTIKAYPSRVGLSNADLKQLLGISTMTLHRLKKKNKRGFGLSSNSLRNVRRYLKSHHHSVANHQFDNSKNEEKDMWLTLSEAADFIGRSPSYVKKLRYEKRIAFVQNSPRTFLYSQNGLKSIPQKRKK